MHSSVTPVIEQAAMIRGQAFSSTSVTVLTGGWRLICDIGISARLVRLRKHLAPVNYKVKSLPLNCTAYYQPGFLTEDEALALFEEITSGFDVTNRIVKMEDGSEFVSETGSYVFCDSGLTSLEALPEVWGARSAWTDSLVDIRDRIAALTGVKFRVARCIFYQDGSEGVDFHGDEPAYGDTSEIASLSLGAERVFVMRCVNDPDDSFSISLESGSLLFMGKGSQQNYEHALPHDDNCFQPRINLTFRKYGWE
jgi:alkylated DNA repair dioxygenase AlkB